MQMWDTTTNKFEVPDYDRGHERMEMQQMSDHDGRRNDSVSNPKNTKTYMHAYTSTIDIIYFSHKDLILIENSEVSLDPHSISILVFQTIFAIFS